MLAFVLGGSRRGCGEAGGCFAGFVTGTALRAGTFLAQDSAEHPRRAVGFVGYCIVRVAYHRFQSSSSPGRANPHDGSARVRCWFK